jgi:hypothetical protein
MTKTIPTIFTIALCLLVGGGCVKKSHPATQPTVTYETPTTTPSSTSSMHSSESVSSTVSLLDRPVSEWPRYEFKELGFSIQLPFNSSTVTSSLIEQSGTGCSFPTHHYKARVNGLQSFNTFLGANTRYVCFPHEGVEYAQPLTDLHDFTMTKNTLTLLLTSLTSTPEVGVTWPDKPIWETIILKTIAVGKNQLVLFDPKPYYQLEENVADILPDEAVVFKTQNNPRFKAVLMQFSSKDLPYILFEKSLKTVRF